MRIILLQDIKSLGKKGDIKDVAEGYARNFLFPKKIAQIATESAIKQMEIQKEREKSLELAKNIELKSLAEKIKGKKIVITAKEKKGKLFGSITAKNIKEELEKEGLNISTDSVIIKETIKKIGEYEIEIKLTEKIKEKIKIEIKGA
ncbi:MAG: 50S ribosomal protein L9 [Candidatus Moranbacteria bacterium RIFOXYA12_FULL_35_19]|nr:MAG: 50S ribosomal protein L9 [Candidatus Moranbacteria bacterium GW2011_GWF2_35_39]OGI32271.1 MAG: 50S ribosomal protein L9 [Candidatus Moranbacteria bacterium RIFOXYC12_FULL_36_13]OGI32356.1 MAG: 50S ribosomal protein L9 [Candidatus Moranbacteria bacterium RIFOXYB12_FULL_35_8]OGI35866.1 MAG: 50S ribosomal protein L9 [Candidatus Moranbacteria bacterium RIFOXYA12_FULL_35_19]